MSTQNSSILESFSYNDKIVKQFIFATVLWAIVAYLVGVIIALQLADWNFNFGLSWLTFGRLRPLHTNAAIFAFGGNAIFAGIYHSTQRLCKTRIFSDGLSQLHFWGWQLVIVAAAITLPLGITTSKEYAELEWPVDILITVVWVIFAVNFFGTLFRRREKHIYVALWFYIATIVTVAVLHIVNSLALPVSLFKSYSVFAGAQDALVQWWYGHNAVAFFLTTPFLGLMYYYIPKAANRPVYSYRLSIIHFWALVFLYIWAGPHHLLYTALPDWAQTLGVIFSVMLWAPSWGGMINGLLTLRGAWNLVRTEPTLKFMATAVTFYGMSTFEGPLLSIKAVSSLAHYTDWIIGHVHGGTLGWNSFLTFGMLYFLVPKLWKTKLYSVKWANLHFWIGTVGILLYYFSMWAAGITQGLMWRALDESGRLQYPDFVETVMKIVPLYWVRATGGTLFLIGALIMVVNLIKTIKNAPPSANTEDIIKAPALNKASGSGDSGHRKLEGLPFVFTILSVIAILVGSVIEILPTFMMSSDFVKEPSLTKPYTPLELIGRDIYIREGCYTCHSQMIRSLKDEKIRYGEVSKLEDSMWDHPFQWGSRRIGPDLSRVGGKYPDLWHYRHMLDPREINQNSIMPKYDWMGENDMDLSDLPKKISVMKALGVPYTDADVEGAVASAEQEAQAIADGLAQQGVTTSDLAKKEITALISYLQRLGKNQGKN
jgi:cytochrome c oxidase cbb3-type subunit I/II